MNPDQDAEIKSESEAITLTIPEGAVPSAVKIDFTELVPVGSTGMQMLRLFKLDATTVSSGVKVSQFAKDLTITIQHRDGDIVGIDIDSLRLYYLDVKTRQWLPLASTYDSQSMVLSATTDHFTYFGEIGNSLTTGPGRVMASQVDLHSGAVTFSYSFELPPGPGGFQPKLELTYNSGVVDEMKNKQAMGSWVGTGWTLHLGRISRDLSTDIYYLDLNGGSYQLATVDNLSYRTNPDMYFKITRSTDGNTWDLYDRDGIHYRFGSTTDSIQYLYNAGRQYYRWDLSLMEDTNGNQATVSYKRDIRGTSPSDTVRSAYPEYLNYGSAQVHFSSSYDYDDATDGYLRYDSPKTYGSNPAPKTMENAKLDYIEVKFNSSLVRKYTLSYNYTNAYYSGDYGGIYYAGTHTLASITQKDSADSLSLPAMTFTYQNLQTYRHSNEGDYTGNPGNPASFTWPHLTAVNSGYGGSSTFTYTQTPSTSVLGKWTREVATSKTIASGISPDQAYTYSYNSGESTEPTYLGGGWDQKYRGFDKVRETDAAGNYSIHYYYTTGFVGGKDAEKLTGREYKTEWFNSADTKLWETAYDWNVVTTSQDYDVVTVWSEPGNPADDGALPAGFLGAGLAPSADGSFVYTTSYINYPSYHRVQKFDQYGTYAGTKWGSQGSQNGQFQSPMGIAIQSITGYVYVADYGNSRIQVFDGSGSFLFKFSVNPWYPLQRPADVTVSNNSYGVFVADEYANRIQAYDYQGNLMYQWGSFGTGDGQFNYPRGVAVDSSGYVYVADTSNNRIQKFSNYGVFQTKWGSYGSGDGQFNWPEDVAIDSTGNVYVADLSNKRVQQFSSSGSFIRKWQSPFPVKYVAVSSNALYYSGSVNDQAIVRQVMPNWTVRLNQVDETVGSKTSRTRYLYDDYGNVVTVYLDGDTSTTDDDSTIWQAFYPNATANILDKPARERVYATIVTEDNGGSNLKKETLYYYDGNNTSYTTPPTKGNVTRVEQKKDASSSMSTYYTYDSYGNRLTVQDPNGNTTTWTYDATYNVYPASKAYPVTGLSESYSYDLGTGNLLSQTDVNGQTTSYEYDTFKRLTKVIKPGDSSGSPSLLYEYLSWGTLNQQSIRATVKIDANDSLWQRQYFDGLGRVVQTQAEGLTDRTIISSTTAFNNRGLVDRQYVSQDLPSSEVNGYKAPDAGWKYVTFAYDGLGRVTTQTNADGTTVSHDYSTAWQDLVTNPRGYETRYYSDAFGRLVKVEEVDASQQVYATTNYTYDVLGNLTEVKDNSNNTTTVGYDWLSRKAAMTDPDMGSWSYGYDASGNLTSQTDAKSQTITLAYDALNRLTGKTYPQGSGMTDVTYTYDSTSGGNYGKGLRTGMSDALGNTSYRYDNRGRLIEEKRTVDSVDYTTSYTYFGTDQVYQITYPTGETVTNGYDARGLPYSVSGSTGGNLVTGAYYNGLGQVTEIRLGNGLKTTYGYYGTGGTYDTTGGYYGRLWEIKTLPQAGGTAIQDMKHTWDAGGNLGTREDVLASQTETFGYDFLDRLTSVSGPYTESITYNQIGNITSRNGVSYSYGTKPHAVTARGSHSYTYDDNGNMTARGAQTITWDVESRVATVSTPSSSFVYDGNGERVKKTQGSETTLYVNKYYEKNLTSGEVTAYYYLGDRLVAQRKGTTVSYIHQDHLTGTSVTSNASGSQTSTIKYYPFGQTRSTSGTIPTDRRFTGQRLDSTGLYYYGARYYDPYIGRFISADTLVPSPANPQSLNRYSYVLNNPLRYVDPSGHWVYVTDPELRAGWDVFKSVAADEAALMERPGVSYYIGWSLTPEESFSVGGEMSLLNITMGQFMFIDVGLQGTGSLAAIAVDIGHESFHALEGRFADSVFEEVGASQFATEIGNRILRRLQSTEQDGNGNEAIFLLDERFYRKLGTQQAFAQYDLTKTGVDLVNEMTQARQQLRDPRRPVYDVIPLLPPTRAESAFVELAMILSVLISWIF